MVLHQQHHLYEKKLIDNLNQLGFLTASLTYHDHLDNNIKNELSNRYSPTSLYIRTRADRFAIHKTKSVEFEFEVKTRDNPRYGNMAIEMFPLVIHKQKSNLGVRCLYAYFDPISGFDCAFWSSTPPKIWRIYIPTRWTQQQQEWFEAIAIEFFPESEIIKRRTGGSSDPFVLIKEETLKKLPTWDELVSQLLLV